MSSMSTDVCVDVPMDAFLAARRAWPGRGHDDQLPAPVRRVFDSWMAVSEDDRLCALDAAVREGFARRPGRDSPRAQCQDLTLSGSPLPAAHSDVCLLTADQIVAMGGDGNGPYPHGDRKGRSYCYSPTGTLSHALPPPAQFIAPTGGFGAETSSRFAEAVTRARAWRRS